MRRLLILVLLGVFSALQVSAQPAQSGAKSSGGPQEGIKVRGHWTIVVRDTDGRVADRREFDNALDVFVGGAGRPILANLLTRNRAISQWVIQLGNSGPGGPPCAAGACFIFERESTRFPFVGDRALGLTVGVNRDNTGQALLVGTTRASNDGLITSVRTLVSLCPPGFASPTGCADTEEFFNFSVASSTDTSIGPVSFNTVSVRTGQTIDVTVRFSFS